MSSPTVKTVPVIVPEQPPPIETDNLFLRAMKDGDDEQLFALRQCPELFYFDEPYLIDETIEETREFMQLRIFSEGPDHIRGLSFSYVIMEKSPSGAVHQEEQPIIGYIIIGIFEPVPEVGYGLHPQHHNKGFMTQALRGVLDKWWSLPRMPNTEQDARQEYMHARCVQANRASLAVLIKCGFEVYAEGEYNWLDTFYLRASRPSRYENTTAN